MADAITNSQEILNSVALRDSVRQEVGYDPPRLTLYSAKPIPEKVLAKIRGANPDVTVVAVKTKYDLEVLYAESYRIASTNLDTVTWASPTPDLSGISIGVTTALESASTMARTAMPDAATFTTYPATVEPAAPAISSSRLNDTPPIYGGSRIVKNSSGGQCTSAIPVNYTLASSPTTSRVGFLTAWHCGTGLRWDNTAGTIVGSANLGISDSSIDSQVVQNASTTSGTNRIWVGGYSGTSTRYIAAAASPAGGERLCAGGSMSGEVCNVVVSNNADFPLNVSGRTYNHVYGIVNDNKVNSLQPCVAQPGDSGGPSYVVRSDGKVTIRGMIIAINPGQKTTYCPGQDPNHPTWNPVSGAVASGNAYAVRITPSLTAVRATLRTG